MRPLTKNNIVHQSLVDPEHITEPLEFRTRVVTVTPPDRQTAIDGLKEIETAIKDSVSMGLTATQTQKWILGLVGTTLNKLGSTEMSEDEFNNLFTGVK